MRQVLIALVIADIYNTCAISREGKWRTIFCVYVERDLSVQCGALLGVLQVVHHELVHFGIDLSPFIEQPISRGGYIFSISVPKLMKRLRYAKKLGEN